MVYEEMAERLKKRLMPYLRKNPALKDAEKVGDIVSMLLALWAQAGAGDAYAMLCVRDFDKKLRAKDMSAAALVSVSLTTKLPDAPKDTPLSKGDAFIEMGNVIERKFEDEAVEKVMVDVRNAALSGRGL